MVVPGRRELPSATDAARRIPAMPSSPDLASPPSERPLRLAFFGDANSIHVRRWSGWFADRGHDVTLLVPAGFDVKPELSDALSVEPFRAYYQGPFRPYGYVAEERSLRRVLARLRPDVVHAHFLTEYGWHAWMSGFHPYAITVWGSDVTISLRRSWRTALYGRIALRSADLVTGDSVSLIEDVIAAGARRDRTRLAQFGVDTGRFSPGPDPTALRARLGLKGRRVLFSPRAITHLYRHGVAVEALAELPADVVLLMARYLADEKEMAAILARAQALGVSERVCFVDGIDHADMPDFYRLADVVLSIPCSDATPVTLLEALACGRTVVATDLPSIREWMADLDAASLVAVDDVAATARAIGRLLSMTPGERSELGRRGRAIIEERASQDAHMTAVEGIYRKLAASRR
jgi:glycosyltransferase involved in cell wall biosynthesis